MRRTSLATVAVCAVCAMQLNGCTGVVIGAGATVAAAAVEERGLAGAASDAAIYARITEAWLAHDVEMYQGVGLTIVEGRVLLTGNVRSVQSRLDAVRLAWQVGDAKEVINEIEVTDKGGPAGFARDAWVSAQLVTKLLFDKTVQSINYSVETVNGVVYLMGIAQNQDELNRVTDHARNVSYVTKVVSYVRLKDDPRRKKS